MDFEPSESVGRESFDESQFDPSRASMINRGKSYTDLKKQNENIKKAK